MAESGGEGTEGPRRLSGCRRRLSDEVMGWDREPEGSGYKKGAF